MTSIDTGVIVTTAQPRRERDLHVAGAMDGGRHGNINGYERSDDGWRALIDV